MSFRWADYVNLAKELFDESVKFSAYEEARLRTVVSRSYYGVFKTAYTTYFSKVNPLMPEPKRNVHEWLIERYKLDRSQHCLGDHCKKIAGQLDKLKEYRVKADYRNSLEEDPERLARKALKHAERALSLLGSI